MDTNVDQRLVSRRQFLQATAALGGSVTLLGALPAWARGGPGADLGGLRASANGEFDLHVRRDRFSVDDRNGSAIRINDQLPAPLLRWREGQQVVLRVTNHLDVDTSIHWHGILLPFQMDGVPGVSFPGIAPGETFVYEFPVIQSGTYWYHSHSGLQEQLGHYGPIIIEPEQADPVIFDREYMVMLSDWTFEDPHQVFANLKKMGGYYNHQQRDIGDFIDAARDLGFKRAKAQQSMWGSMRMDPTDIADVTAATYTYLINGHGPSDNWTALFKPGERVRLRFVNAAAMSIFNVRIPGLPMTVVQADGINVQPVDTDEFQIGVAETLDVIVQPEADKAYRLVAESNDRSGMALGTLSSNPVLSAPAPALRKRPTLTMKDMAMSHGRSNAQQHNHAKGPGVVGLAEAPTNRLGECPAGLEDVDHRVLVYTDLKALDRNPDTRPPQRELELHLTSNMERYMWSFDGIKFSDVDEPIKFYKGERLRLTLVNDTMMPHPIHLHGMFFDVVTAEDEYKPRKHTIVAKPGEKFSIDINADAVGDWAFHCHLLYHMHAGMMRVVSVVDEVPAA